MKRKSNRVESSRVHSTSTFSHRIDRKEMVDRRLKNIIVKKFSLVFTALGVCNLPDILLLLLRPPIRETELLKRKIRGANFNNKILERNFNALDFSL